MPNVLDHIQLSVADYPRAKAFYAKALEPLGFTLAMEFPEDGPPSYGGFAADNKPYFWLAGMGRQTPPTHIAFGAATQALVDAFYTAAIAAGASDNGPPGTREMYHASYYAAYVRDPEGHNIEAVCHGEMEIEAPATKPRVAKRKPARRAAAAKPAARSAGKPAAKKKPATRKATAKKPAAAKKPTRKAATASKAAARRRAVAKKRVSRGRKTTR